MIAALVTSLVVVLGAAIILAVDHNGLRRIVRSQADLIDAQRDHSDAMKRLIEAQRNHVEATLRSSELDDAYVRAVRDQYRIADTANTPGVWRRDLKVVRDAG